MFKNTMRITMFLFCISIMSTLNGQNNYLDPCVDWGSRINSIKLYNFRFNEISNTRLNQEFIIRFIVKPSFEAEYQFQIEKDSSEKFELNSLIFSENLWYAENPDSVQVHFQERIIDPDLANKLEGLFKKITISATKREVGYLDGEDGVNYYFYWKSKTNEIFCGECWSPSKESPLFELVSICNLLFEAKIDNLSLNNEIIERIDSLYLHIE